MKETNGGFDWRFVFAVFCLFYTVGVVYLALGNFDKVHGEYRWARERSQPDQVREIALEELVDKCRKKNRRAERPAERYRRDATGMSPDADNDPCLSWPQPVLENKQQEVAQRLEVNRDKLRRKVVVFYISFGFFFLFVPLALLYLIVSFLVWLFKDMKFMK